MRGEMAREAGREGRGAEMKEEFVVRRGIRSPSPQSDGLTLTISKKNTHTHKKKKPKKTRSMVRVMHGKVLFSLQTVFLFYSIIRSCLV